MRLLIGVQKIRVKNNASGPVNCSYTVYGEKKTLKEFKLNTRRRIMGLDLSGVFDDLIAKQLKDAENLTAGLTPEKVGKSLRDDFDSMDNQVQRL